MSPWLSDVLLRSQSDERLASLARDGLERAFAILVERHRKPLLRFARRLTGDDSGAEDVVQQTLMSAWAALQRGSEVEHVRGWLHQIVRHAAARAAQRETDTDELPPGLVGSLGSDADLEPRMDVLDLVAAVNALPDRQRVALIQTALEGRPRLEIAEEMNLSEGSVRQLVHRARTTLRTAVTAITPMPLVTWAATRSATGMVGADRIAEIAGGAAATGGVATAMKAGTVAIIAAGAVASTTGVPVQTHHRHHPSTTNTSTATTERVEAAAAPKVTQAAAPVVAALTTGRRHHVAAILNAGSQQQAQQRNSTTTGTHHSGNGTHTGDDKRSGHRPASGDDHRFPTPVPTVTHADDHSGGDHGTGTSTVAPSVAPGDHPEQDASHSGSPHGSDHGSGDETSTTPTTPTNPPRSTDDSGG